MEREVLNAREKPLTLEEIKKGMDENCFISGEITIGLSNILAGDFENFLDELSMRLVGNELLMDVAYEVVQALPFNELVIKVTGDASSVIESLEQEAGAEHEDRDDNWSDDPELGCKG